MPKRNLNPRINTRTKRVPSGTTVDENPTPPRYNKMIRGIKIDPYRILLAYGITHPAHQHAIKKLLRAGKDPHQSFSEDIGEVIDALKRLQEMEAENLDA